MGRTPYHMGRWLDCKRIGKICKAWRRGNTPASQAIVGEEIGFSRPAVENFENGKNDSMIILLWYLKRGMPLYLLFEGDSDEIK